MKNAEEFAELAALIAEPKRASMLWQLLDGRAYTAGELAITADISPQSASNHINKLLEHDILVMEKQGRHRYYALARPEIAYALEALANLLPDHNSETNHQLQDSPQGIRFARTCYDHLAGKMGVRITDALVSAKYLVPENKNYEVTDSGEQWFHSIGIDVQQLRQKKRTLAFQCLDWSERRSHLAGALGAAFLHTLLDKDWLRRKKGSREVVITHSGQEKLDELLSKVR